MDQKDEALHSHVLHMLSGLTTQNPGLLPLSSFHYCMFLLGICSVWDTWAWIYIHYAIILANYDWGTEWLTLCFCIHLLLSCSLSVNVTLLSTNLLVCPSPPPPMVFLIAGFCQACCALASYWQSRRLQVNKRASGEPCGHCWCFSLQTLHMHTLSSSHTPGNVMSKKRGIHNVGEVHRMEDARSTTGKKGRISGVEIKTRGCEWLLKNHAFPHKH